MAGGAAAAASASASVVVAAPPVVTEDNMSFLDGPDSDPEPTPDENQGGQLGGEGRQLDDNKMEVSPPQQPAQMNVVEPEEKILVDLPVELAAVNDLDDGIPMMSATSYPGQEWNPYGAGEFGDWE
ncbi:hypothetical protein NPX13_g10930 [Xylaria arbuscula]|uniref:Uncharacterized protein n=1 Tax=Xylaria arbuscula TaxID=114810 RepID=A0A9W8N3T7_9PEZI|nr:hypothetical protein NPX13_g10930 [Xylaria arbuscula]